MRITIGIVGLLPFILAAASAQLAPQMLVFLLLTAATCAALFAVRPTPGARHLPA